MERFGRRDKIVGFLENHPFFFAAVLSVFASLIAIHTRGLINSDGAFFLSLAEMAQQDGFSAVAELYRMPFFPWLLTAIAQLLFVDLQFAADLLGTIFWAVASVSFVGILRVFNSEKNTVFAGMLAVIFFPVINEIRADVYRDSGYVAFSLLAILAFFKFYRNKDLRYLLGGGALVIVGCLFRVEAAIFFLLPFFLIKSSRLKLFYFVALSAFVGSGLWIWFSFYSDQQSGLLRYVISAVGSVWENVEGRVEVAEHALLNRQSEKHAFGFVVFGSLFLLLIPIFNNLKWFLFYLLFFVFKRDSLAKIDSPLYAAVGLTFLPLIFQIMHGNFLQARYAILISLLILICLIIKFSSVFLLKTKKIKIFVILFLSCLFVDSFISTGPSRSFSKEAVVWAKQKTPIDSKVISNKRNITYSVHKFKEVTHAILDNIDCDIINDYDYYLFSSGKRPKKLPTCLESSTLLIEFKNKEGHKVVIYQVNKENSYD